MISYAIYPTQHLMDIVQKEYSQSKRLPVNMWHEETLWEIMEYEDVPIHAYESHYAPRVKLIILARLARDYEMESTREHGKSHIRMIKSCFGEPPEFNVKRFDDLWTIKRINHYFNCGMLLVNTETKYLQQVQRTGDDSLDKWFFENVIGVKSQIESLEDGSPEKEQRLQAFKMIVLPRRFWDWEDK